MIRKDEVQSEFERDRFNDAPPNPDSPEGRFIEAIKVAGKSLSPTEIIDCLTKDKTPAPGCKDTGLNLEVGKKYMDQSGGVVEIIHSYEYSVSFKKTPLFVGFVKDPLPSIAVYFKNGERYRSLEKHRHSDIKCEIKKEGGNGN